MRRRYGAPHVACTDNRFNVPEQGSPNEVFSAATLQLARLRQAWDTTELEVEALQLED